MAITRVSYGAFHNVFNTGNQPSPGAFAIGDTLLIFTGEVIGSDLLTTPSGWTLLSSNSAAKQTAIFGLVSVTGTETMPSMNWGNQFTWAIVAAYRGVNGLTVTNVSDRQTNQTTNIIGPAGIITPTQDGSLVLLVGNKNKTATSNGSVFSAPANFTVAAAQTQSGGSTANVICEWIQTTATAVPANQAIAGTIADGSVQTTQGTLIVLAPTPPPATAATQGYVKGPGSPNLASPRNTLQFHGVAGISQAPSISAPISGLFASNSTVYAPIARFAPLSVGFVPTPGPGVGPFTNGQFDTFTWATTNPSPTLGLMAGEWDSSSTWYASPSSQAGQLNGIWTASSTVYGEGDGLIAGSMSGILASTSTVYTAVGGILDMSFALAQSNSTLTMLQIGGTFQPLVPFTAVVDVRLNIGYQPWKIHPEGTIG